MLTLLFLLVVGASAFNDTHQEIVVSSGALAVKEPPKEQEESAEVVPMPRGSQGRWNTNAIKKLFKRISPYLYVPVMMAIGYAPFVLASLKMMVMSAVTLNMMAVNAAIFMSLRNMAFGPRTGQHVRYKNYGYKNRRAQENHHHHYHRR